MERFRGVVYRDEENRLLLLWPHQGRATEISDANDTYAELSDEAMDVVDVEVDLDHPHSVFTMKSIRRIAVMRPPSMDISPVQMTEWPSKSYDALEYIMTDPDRIATFVAVLNDESD